MKERILMHLPLSPHCLSVFACDLHRYPIRLQDFGEGEEFLMVILTISSQVKSALLSILPHVQHIHTEN